MTSLSEHLAKVYGSTDPQTLKSAYQAWAQNYNADLSAVGYSYPALTAALVCRHIPDTSSHILDAGAGTGLIGNLLRILGYHNLVGIDLSEDMLAVADTTDAYQSLHTADLSGTLEFADNHFDACYSAGTFTPGHAPPHGLRELTRVVRPGGKLIVTLTETGWKDYGGFLQGLCDEGLLSLLERTAPHHVFPYSSNESHLLARLEVYTVR